MAEKLLKLLTAAIAVAGLLFGIYRFLDVQSIEASKPYLTKKLEYCIEAVEVAASIANADVPSQKEIERFWQLYWGAMGLFENQIITQAMIEFGTTLKDATQTDEGSKGDGPLPSGLKGQSLKLAHECRGELATEWSPSWGKQN
ncbi:MAG: hypothetical protein ABJN26_00075 [Stappiaceae bacterium]